MEESKKTFVALTFYRTFTWMDCRHAQALYEKIMEEVCEDIEETADDDFTSEDVRIAIRRVLFEKLGINN